MKQTSFEKKKGSDEEWKKKNFNEGHDKETVEG
jgi:hypothetical protein